MAAAAAGLEYERAALLRDQITELKSGSGPAKIEPRRSRHEVSCCQEGPQKIADRVTDLGRSQRLLKYTSSPVRMKPR